MVMILTNYAGCFTNDGHDLDQWTKNDVRMTLVPLPEFKKWLQWQFNIFSENISSPLPVTDAGDGGGWNITSFIITPAAQ